LLHELQEAIALRTGVTVVTGGSVTNRHALCRALAKEVREHAFTALVLDTIHSEKELLAHLLRDFGVVSRDQSRVGHRVGVAHSEMMEALERFLRGLIPIDAAAVLLVDRAETLPAPVLLKMAQLATLEEGGRPLLQMVLMGSGELDALLNEPALSALNSRVSGRHSLPETVDETEAASRTSWLRHRPTVATAVVVVLLGCVLAIVVGITLLRRLSS
jgi:type II secretory pathway predicted ATPase ExeA